jgi:hypothetical protein
VENTIQEYAANFSAIIASKRIPFCKKEILLKNIVKDMRFTYLEEFKKIKTYEHSEEKKELLGCISCLEDKIKKISKIS